jgi:3-deoxy-manno-octulosonate cytidylyltransferase (CMP-KDO synthetase)
VGELLVATDDRRIADAVESFGGNVTITSGSHATGTDRVAEIAETTPYDIVVNLQGDEPVFDPALVEKMVERLTADPDADIVTACHAVDSQEEFRNPNAVKLVADRNGRVLYFSRSPIPHGAGEGTEPGLAYRHVGVYAFRKDVLLRFARLDRTPLEKSESLEQLRALENGMNMAVVVTDSHTVGVDVPADVKKVEKELNRIYTGLNGSENL